MVVKTAILVDAAFYEKRATILFGKKEPEERADELVTYCNRHLKSEKEHAEKYLYRIFVYDCPPSEKQVFHPLLQRTINLKKTALYEWSNRFHRALANKRKVALRMGELLESSAGYTIRPEALKQLCCGRIDFHELTEQDFFLDIKQKGVDMKIGLDIVTLATKRLADQIVLIAGDSDFVPAAKYARREGVDFILDPLWHPIKNSLNEHIDGLHSCVPRPPDNLKDILRKQE